MDILTTGGTLALVITLIVAAVLIGIVALLMMRA